MYEVRQLLTLKFGAKIAVSVLNGYFRIEHLSWDAFNESKTLQDTVERHKAKTGVYPERILADKIYRTRENLEYCKLHGIHMNGPKLGRPPKDKELYAQQCRDERMESGERNEVEGKFGTGKRCYGMNILTARLKGTSETRNLHDCSDDESVEEARSFFCPIFQMAFIS